jgi:hypothetical protein
LVGADLTGSGLVIGGPEVPIPALPPLPQNKERRPR